jgi:5-methylcytosine-specific restriction endonuclease McrA
VQSWKKTILAARIDPKKNPENILLVGARPKVKSLGMLLRKQEQPIDVFIKTYPGSPDYDKDRHWIYKGRFENNGHSTSRKEIANYAAEVGRPSSSIAFMIFLTPVKGKFGSIITADDLQADQAQREQEAEVMPREQRLARLAKKSGTPESVWVTSRAFARDADVIIETRYRANGICEACLEPAPFARQRDGQPYLEVHHKVPLANGGKDTLENAVALCPNCHRREHHGDPKFRVG